MLASSGSSDKAGTGPLEAAGKAEHLTHEVPSPEMHQGKDSAAGDRVGGKNS